MAKKTDFEWDDDKDQANQEKHGISFALAQLAFLDQHIKEDCQKCQRSS